jgi:hypothetical protein
MEHESVRTKDHASGRPGHPCSALGLCRRPPADPPACSIVSDLTSITTVMSCAGFSEGNLVNAGHASEAAALLLSIGVSSSGVPLVPAGSVSGQTMTFSQALYGLTVIGIHVGGGSEHDGHFKQSTAFYVFDAGTTGIHSIDTRFDTLSTAGLYSTMMAPVPGLPPTACWRPAWVCWARWRAAASPDPADAQTNTPQRRGVFYERPSSLYSARYSWLSLWLRSRWIIGRLRSCDSRMRIELDSLLSNTGKPSSLSWSTMRCGSSARGWNWLTTMPSICRSALWSALISLMLLISVYSAWREKSSQSNGIRQLSAAIRADWLKKL